MFALCYLISFLYCHQFVSLFQSLFNMLSIICNVWLCSVDCHQFVIIIMLIISLAYYHSFAMFDYAHQFVIILLLYCQHIAINLSAWCHFFIIVFFWSLVGHSLVIIWSLYGHYIAIIRCVSLCWHYIVIKLSLFHYFIMLSLIRHVWLCSLFCHQIVIYMSLIWH